MKKIIMTCPFTGIEFTAIKSADGDIIATNPITNEEVKMNYNNSCNRYYIEPSQFKHVETTTPIKAAKILGISVQRVSKLMSDGRLKAFEPLPGVKIIPIESVLDYRKHRKINERSSNGTGNN